MMSVVYLRPRPSRPWLRRSFSLLLALSLTFLLSYLILGIHW